MAAAAATYVDWPNATAGRVEEAATQAKAAASAYGAAVASTVPPPVIADNRALLLALVTTNLLGQNTAAIAATEAHYAEMWAQDVAAMYGYATASASAAGLTPFTPPVSRTKAGGLAGQAAALATGTTASTNAHTVLTELTATIPTALQGLASPLQSTTVSTASASGLSEILAALGLDTPVSFLTPINTGLASTSLSGAYAAWGSATRAEAGIGGTQQMISDTEGRILNRFDQLSSLRSAGSTALAGVEPPAMSASSGRAVLVGGLAVPQPWAVNAPAMRTVAWTLPPAALSAAADEMATGPGSLFAETAVASAAIARRPTGGTYGDGRRSPSSSAARSATAPLNARGSPWTGIAVELRELAQLRDSGILTDEEFARQKRRLLGA
jgi:PPE-repeat protein